MHRVAVTEVVESRLHICRIECRPLKPEPLARFHSHHASQGRIETKYINPPEIQISYEGDCEEYQRLESGSAEEELCYLKALPIPLLETLGTPSNPALVHQYSRSISCARQQLC